MQKTPCRKAAPYPSKPQFAIFQKKDLTNSNFPLEKGGHVQIDFQDSGKGISEELKEKIFEPFFTTKKSKGGTGLGLASVFGCIRDHSGRIQLKSQRDRGSTFTIFLPLSGPVPSLKADLKKSTIKGSGSLLVIDDEREYLEFYKEALSQLGYSVTLCQEGQKGIALYKKNPSAFHLVILDMNMPGIDGKECFKLLKKINPSVKILICSGYSSGIPEAKAGPMHILQKPFSLQKLKASLEITFSQTQ